MPTTQPLLKIEHVHKSLDQGHLLKPAVDNIQKMSAQPDLHLLGLVEANQLILNLTFQRIGR